MGELVNLNRARKARARLAAEQQAAANRAQHGRSGAEKRQEREAAEKQRRLLDGARLETPERD